MKVDELRVLEGEELTGRLKTARRELYELRFKHAVGQLENWSQIAKARHDIARIMTVLSERELGIEVVTEAPEVLPAEPESKKTRKPEFVDEEEEPASAAAAQVAATEPEAAAEEAKPEEEAPKKRRKKSEKSEKSEKS